MLFRSWLSSFCKINKIPFILEPVSVPPAAKFSGIDLQGMYMLTPNEDELPALCTNKNHSTIQEQANVLLARGV